MVRAALPHATFTVARDQDIFHTQEKLEKRERTVNKACRVVWNILSVIIFPIGLARLTIIVVRLIATSMIFPAGQEYNWAYQTKELEKKNADWNKTKATLDAKKALLKGEKSANKIAKLQEETQRLRDRIRVLEVGYSLGGFIRPSMVSMLNKLDKGREDFLRDNKASAEQITVETADGVKLDTLVWHNSEQERLPADQQKWIIHFNGNCMCYEERLDSLKELSNDSGASVYLFNYRGVMRSEGSFERTHDLVVDGEALVQYLLNQGVREDNILIHGLSLGGAAGVEVAANHRRMHHCNERSLSTIPNFLKGMLTTTLLPRRLAHGLGSLVGKIVEMSGHRFDSVKHYRKIDGNKFLIYCAQDEVMNHPAGLYLKVNESAENMIRLPDWYGHCEPMEGRIYSAYISKVQQALGLESEIESNLELV
ncbi:MAG: Multifunctional-autoprocessing repeats-in-toxin [Chlamydiae bacterium]|nr:Multifunctional-autoprocessing repeats-in-toxin [Chlamydiota bacterium]